MRAPKIPSMFRNVRTEPRRFELRSRHYDPKQKELEERRKKIEEEMGVHAEGEDQAPPKRIDLKGKRARRNSYTKSSRSSFYRLLIILAILIFLAYRGLKWLELLEPTNPFR
jgi:hypothetical protein